MTLDVKRYRRSEPQDVEVVEFRADMSPAEVSELADWCGGMAIASPRDDGTLRYSMLVPNPTSRENDLLATPGGLIVKAQARDGHAFYPASRDALMGMYHEVTTS
ncbi:hypothetical protein [Mycobacteroides abscessus]|uniref:hypothetical protein n=1 Tax=Mycobacteroides abscessus TaxID=36809 RepID=UPI000929BEF5|nr:hypothetical protein [Mycobacteroides abscessus]DAZ90299.1 TPA_asm: hypothetical protein PROPHIFSQJ01-1_13 [Mycobacterium phage prophiFSQJ01-1]SII40263.1 Uncharacterised protein [Mycobacteroides abscessus subsp. abscessus]SIK15006.1 Uncharacterised protein [Mycobacteroides abscessus subsp. abscessus]SIN24867.1 Uncharacterised protein [Mycobacteroides abscessus subsp. abscessus]SLI52087.1 Uncharacterised protein [Mycobacteroides abscessus subsp. abscessus]